MYFLSISSGRTHDPAMQEYLQKCKKFALLANSDASKDTTVGEEGDTRKYSFALKPVELEEEDNDYPAIESQKQKALKTSTPSMMFKNSYKIRVLEVRHKSSSLMSKNLGKQKNQEDSSEERIFSQRIRTIDSPADTLKRERDEQPKTKFRKKSKMISISTGISPPSRNKEVFLSKDMRKL
jgi:hypothetical protein